MAKSNASPKYKISENGELRDATPEEEALIDAVRADSPDGPTPVRPA